MIGRLHLWWRARTSRERRLLGFLAVIAGPMLLWYGIAQPFDRLLDRQQAARDADARGLADIVRMAGRVRSAGVSPARPGGSIDGLVRIELERAGFSVTSLERDGAGVLLVMEAVRAQPFFAWLADVKQRRGIVVGRLIARSNADATLSVSVRLERAR